MNSMIDVDYTILIQLVNFLVTIVILNYLLIKPVREQIASRRNFAHSHTAATEAFTAEADAKLTAYEAALSEARSQAAALREDSKIEGHAREQEIVSNAHADAQKFLQSSREDIDRETRLARDELLGRIDVFASRAASKVFS